MSWNETVRIKKCYKSAEPHYPKQALGSDFLLSCKNVERLTQILGSSCYLQRVHGAGRRMVAVPKEIYVISFHTFYFFSSRCIHVESHKIMPSFNSTNALSLLYIYFFCFRLILLWYVSITERLWIIVNRFYQTELVISTAIRRVSKALKENLPNIQWPQGRQVTEVMEGYQKKERHTRRCRSNWLTPY